MDKKSKTRARDPATDNTTVKGESVQIDGKWHTACGMEYKGSLSVEPLGAYYTLF